eukprot:3340685-Alexandrium_andersonii.AAC.1
MCIRDRTPPRALAHSHAGSRHALQRSCPQGWSFHILTVLVAMVPTLTMSRFRMASKSFFSAD